MIGLTCKICNASSLRSLGKIEGYRVNTFFDVVGCPICETNFVLPNEPDEKVYETIYKNVAFVPGYARYLVYADQILKEKNPLEYLMNSEECYWGVAQAILAETQGSPPAESLIWEVGCGQGYLTYALRKAGFNSVGLDISETAVALAQRRYGNFYFCEEARDYLMRTKRRPSLIVLSEVIEHIPDPIAFVLELVSYLQPNGAIIITTPNKTACRSTAIWDTELPPVHLWWFTAKGLEALGERLSCKTMFVDFDQFYKKNQRYLGSNDSSVNQRLPFLDKEYRLIVRTDQSASTFFSNLKSIIKRTIPKHALRKIRKLNAKWHGSTEVSASNPVSLCVVYKAKKYES